MRKQSITETSISKLEAGKRLWDTKTRGFCVRRQHKAAVFYLTYNHSGRKRWYRIGQYGSPWTIDAARKEADKVLARVSSGEDPAAVKAIDREDRAKGLSLEALFNEYVAAQKAAGLANAIEVERAIKKDLIPALGNKHPARVTDLEIEAVIDKVALRGLGAARHLLAYTRSLFNYGLHTSPAIRKKYRLTHNPAEHVGRGRRGKPGKYGRAGVDDRHLTDAEIPVFLAALNASGAATSTKQILVLLLLTGQRPSEVRETDISELDLEDGAPVWRIPKERTKNGLPHLVPLAPQVAAIFKEAVGKRKSGPVFASDDTKDGVVGEYTLRQAIERLFDSKSNPLEIPRFSPKDLRTTVKTGLAALRVPREIRDAVQNHRPEGIGDRAYNFHEYATEKREALERWADHVENLVRLARAKKLF